MNILKTGSLCRVTRPDYEGKLALGKVNSIVLVYPPDTAPYVMVWVDMLLDCQVRLFDVDELQAMSTIKNGFDQELEFDKVAA